jgi:uncharacterized protein YuzE
MALERHAFTVQGAKPPTVEWDVDADSVYVRFSRRPVARTLDQNARKMIVAIDLDARDQVIGIEAVGLTRFTLGGILAAANVRAPKVDLSAAEFQPAKSAA